MKIAGLDIGTTGCKLTVFDGKGKELKRAYRDYPVKRDSSGHEIDFNALTESVFEVLTEISAEHPDLDGIGVTSFGETFVLTNADGRPLHTAMLYTDPRGAEECAELKERIGEKRLAEITGMAAHEMYSLPKAMWLKKHRPELYESARHLFLVEDYVVFLLTGCAQLDYSLATRSMGFDLKKLDWSAEIFAAAGIDVALMSKPVPSGTDAGVIRPNIAEKTGLSKTCHIVSVSQDQVAAAVGSGAFESGVGVDGAGTVECLIPLYDQMPEPERMAQDNYVIVPYVKPGSFVTYAFSYTGGALLQWAMETFGKGETNGSMENAYGKDEPTGLLVLPHFAGAATPYMDTGSRGAILGLTTATTPAELYRASMEGVSYEMRLNYEFVLKTGARITRLNATGGGAHSKVWMQMKADVLNLPITALKTVDAGTVGSAMLTGVAVGCFTDLGEAAKTMVEETETYLPRQDMHEKYMKIYERYKQVYRAVRPLV